jgi:hypothetical protein
VEFWGKGSYLGLGSSQITAIVKKCKKAMSNNIYKRLYIHLQEHHYYNYYERPVQPVKKVYSKTWKKNLL